VQAPTVVAASKPAWAAGGVELTGRALGEVGLAARSLRPDRLVLALAHVRRWRVRVMAVVLSRVRVSVHCRGAVNGQTEAALA
jgi:hypothetical protein